MSTERSTIMVVDDDRTVADTLSEVLEEHGFRTYAVYNGEAALAHVQHLRPDLVILDLIMPSPNGFEVCRRIRRDRVCHAIPIMLISGLDSEPEIHYGIAQGADGYIAKPFKIADLIDKCKKMIEQYHTGMKPDPVTGLPGYYPTTKNVLHRLASSERFMLCYPSLIAKDGGKINLAPELRQEVTVKLGTTLQECMHYLPILNGFIGHLGGGHFIVLMNDRQAVEYCNLVVEKFNTFLLKRLKNQGRDTLEALPVRIIIGMVASDQVGNSKTVQELLKAAESVKKQVVRVPGVQIFRDMREQTTSTT